MPGPSHNTALTGVALVGPARWHRPTHGAKRLKRPIPLGAITSGRLRAYPKNVIPMHR